MSGKHAHARTPSPSSRYIPVIAAIAVAVLLLGGVVAAMSIGPAKNPDLQSADSLPQAAVSTGASASASPSASAAARDDQPASRGELRAAPPSPTPSRTPSKSPTKKPNQPSGEGAVTSTGSCEASYYSTGGTTANGEHLNLDAYTAANKTLPFNTRVKVTNKSNGKSVTVRINDRGPFVSGRCLDLTPAAFKAIGSLSSGVINVNYAVLS